LCRGNDCLHTVDGEGSWGKGRGSNSGNSPAVGFSRSSICSFWGGAFRGMGEEFRDTQKEILVLGIKVS